MTTWRGLPPTLEDRWSSDGLVLRLPPSGRTVCVAPRAPRALTRGAGSDRRARARTREVGI
eukprot:12553425-Alexandrium_andersonii.AAC.1